MKYNTCPLCGEHAELTEEDRVFFCYHCNTENWISEDTGVLFTNQGGEVRQHMDLT